MENYCPRGEIQPWSIFTEARRADVNSRLRFNFTEGTIIFYHSPNHRAVNICFKHPIHRCIGPYRTVKSRTVGYRVPNSAAVTASSRVREIVRK